MNEVDKDLDEFDSYDKTGYIQVKQRLIQLRKAIRKHRDQCGDDRCWLDDEELYAMLPEGKGTADTRLNDPAVMLECCKQYIQHRHNPAVPYVSPQREIERLKKEISDLNYKLFKAESKIEYYEDDSEPLI